MEHDDDATTTRVELLANGFYTLRAEQEREEGETTTWVGVQAPGRLFGLDGYASFFARRAPGKNGIGTNFDLGHGLVAVGGSLERATHDFTGLYLRLRGKDLEVAMGSGKRNEEWVWHGGLYAKNVNYSIAVGGAVGPGESRYQHVAGTWQPAERGGGPGAWFGVERESSQEYFAEVFFADKATFNYLTSWGRYGMDQWPHERNFEALGDVMRYFRPSIRNHARTSGVGVVGALYEVEAGEAEVTLDARLFPARMLQRPQSSRPDGSRRYFRDVVLPSLMLGGTRNLSTGATVLMGEVRLPPLVLFGQFDLRGPARPYLFLQYVAVGLL